LTNLSESTCGQGVVNFAFLDQLVYSCCVMSATYTEIKPSWNPITHHF